MNFIKLKILEHLDYWEKKIIKNTLIQKMLLELNNDEISHLSLYD